MSNDDLPPLEDCTPKEEALSDTRQALRRLHALPATGLSGQQQHELLLEARDALEALESSLTNEVSQQEDDDGE